MTTQEIKTTYRRAFVTKMESYRNGYDMDRDLGGKNPLCEPWIDDPSKLVFLERIAKEADEDGWDEEDTIQQQAIEDAIDSRDTPFTARGRRQERLEQRADAERG